MSSITARAAALAICALFAWLGALAIIRDPEPEAPLPREATASMAPPAPSGIECDVSAFPIMFEHGPFRMNVALATIPVVEPSVWRSPAWREVLRVDDASDTFPVRVWRIRDGAPALVETVHLPAQGAAFRQFQVRAVFLRGDVLAVEYVPALVVTDGWPIASLIDTRSGDPTSIPSVRTRITLPLGGEGTVRP